MKSIFSHTVLALLLPVGSALNAEETNPPAVQPVAIVTNAPAGTNSPASTNASEAVLLNLSTNSPVLTNVVAAPSGDTNLNVLTTANSDAPTIPATGFDLRSFRIISERNIFNPNRAPRSSGTRTVTRREPERRTVRSDSFSLVGTMSYTKGRFAFFEGSSSDFKKVVQPDERIAGFKVASVAPNCVRLEGANGEKFDLCVGMRMSRREEEAWRVVEAPGEPSGSSSREPGSSGAGSAGGAEDDVIRKMMQRREQEAGGGAANDAGKGSGGGSAEAPASPATAPAEPGPAKGSGTSAEADEIVKKLLQKREQELNK